MLKIFSSLFLGYGVPVQKRIKIDFLFGALGTLNIIEYIDCLQLLLEFHLSSTRSILGVVHCSPATTSVDCLQFPFENHLSSTRSTQGGVLLFSCYK